MAAESHRVEDTASGSALDSGRRLMTWAVAIWMALALAVAVKTMVAPDQHSVFPKIAIRALDWWSGRPMYTDHPGLGGFPYTPMFAISITPFAVLGNRFGGVLWVWLVMGVYLIGLRRLVRDVLPGEWPLRYEAALLMLAMVGAVRGIWNAQSNALIIGLLMLGCSAIARRRWWPAAVLLAAPFFIKMWTLAVAGLFVALLIRPLAWRYLLLIAVGLVLPFVTQPFTIVIEQHHGWAAYLRELAAAEIGSYYDLGTLLRRFGAPFGKGPYRLIQAAAAAGVLAWCLWYRRRDMDVRRLLTATLAMGAAWVVIFGPGIEYNTYVVLAPAVSWAVLTAFVRGRGRLLVCAAFVMTNVLGMGAIQRSMERLCMATQFIMPVGAFLFIIWLIVYMRPVAAAEPVPHSKELSR